MRDAFADEWLYRTRLELSLRRPTSHMKLTGITDSYGPPPWSALWCQYSPGMTELRRDRRRHSRRGALVPIRR